MYRLVYRYEKTKKENNKEDDIRWWEWEKERGKEREIGREKEWDRAHTFDGMLHMAH